MFCPKCGSESLEAQRFCKACGTNLQLINNALGGSENSQGPTPFGIDVDALAKNARDFAQTFKASWSGAHVKMGELHGSHRDQQRSGREIRRQAREEARRQNMS